MEQQSANLVEYDIRGQICPSCLLMALHEVNQHQQQIKAGQLTLRIMTDNRQATTTIPDALKNMGYGTSVSKQGGYYEIIIAARQ